MEKLNEEREIGTNKKNDKKKIENWKKNWG